MGIFVKNLSLSRLRVQASHKKQHLTPPPPLLILNRIYIDLREYRYFFLEKKIMMNKIENNNNNQEHRFKSGNYQAWL